MIKIKNFPFTVWALTRALKPVELTAKKEFVYADQRGIKVHTGKWYYTYELYESEADAINAGFSRLEDQKAALEIRKAGIVKREIALKQAARHMVERLETGA